MLLPFLAVLKHWKRKPFQLFLFVLGISTATALWTGVQALNSEARKSYAKSAEIITTSKRNTIISLSDNHLNDNYFAKLRRLGWDITPIITGKIGEEKDWTIVGFDPLTSSLNKKGMKLNTEIDFQDFLSEELSVIVNTQSIPAAKELNIFNKFYASESIPVGHIFVDIALAQFLLGMEGKLSELEILGEIPEAYYILDSLKLQIITPENSLDLTNLTKSFHLNLSAFGFLSFLVGLFIVHATITLSLEQRKSLVRILKAIGVSSATIITSLFAEIVVLSLFGGTLGIVMGYVIASMLLPDVALTLKGLYQANVSSELSITPDWWGLGLAMPLAGCISASTPSIITLGNQVILKPKKTESRINSQTNKLLKILLLACLLFFIAITITFSDNLIFSFLLLGSVLLGAGLVLPFFILLIVSLCNHFLSRSSITSWFWADTNRYVGLLSISLMALLIALSINIGVGGMVGSFRNTFIGWLDQRLIADLYVRVTDIKDAKNVSQFLESRAEISLPIISVSKKVDGQILEIYGFLPHQSYRNNWPLLDATPDAWTEIETGKTVFINEQLSTKLKLNIGDDFRLSEKPFSESYKIAAIYSDYGNTKGQIMIPLSLFREKFPEIEPYRFAVHASKKIVNEIQVELGKRYGINESNMSNQADLKHVSKAIFEKTFKITNALSILTLAIAGLAIFTSLTTIGSMRLGQLAPVWAIGLSPGTLAKMELFRTLFISFTTSLIAIPLGVLVSIILTNYINVAAFGWRLPIFFFPEQWLSLVLTSLCITILASLIPVYKIWKAYPSELLRIFSYDN